MALGETVVLGFVAVWMLFLAWAIDRGGAVDLVAGYRKGQLPEAREAELARDVRTVLLAVVGLLGLLVVDAWTGAVPRTGELFVVVTAALVGWLVWKWNVASGGVS